MGKENQTPAGPVYALTIHSSDEIGGPTPLALDSEWLLTNGRGDFAMGTICGCNTRRYHSLLNAAVAPPTDRLNTLPCIAETIGFGGEWHELKTQEFLTHDYRRRTFHPHGYRFLHKFEKTPTSVRWHFRVGPVWLTKELRLVWQRPVAEIVYTLQAANPRDPATPAQVTLSLLPMLAMRHYHHQRRASWGDPFGIEVVSQDGGPHVRFHADQHAVDLRGDSGRFTEQRDWWYDFYRRREDERGQDHVEDLFTPGTLEQTFDLRESAPARWRWLVGLGVDEPGEDARQARLEKHLSHVRSRLKPDTPHTPLIEGLVVAADDFVVRRDVGGRELRTILAGYPWFTDWGRDAMIALPGLLLCTGRGEEAGAVLAAFASSMRDGLVPNCFSDEGSEPMYNTADASLWFIHSALEHRRITGDDRLWRSTLHGACMAVVGAYERGTQGPIGMDTDGLIVAGNEQTQLTWMDAKRDGVVFTPRHGKAVEINALWHRALVGLGQKKLASRVKKSFNAVFWSQELGYCCDHVNEHGADKSLRPNQVLAVSLPDSPLAVTRQKAVMKCVREKLLTPFGLRTLPRDDSNYHGRYASSMFERDKAYHQGTVWPWLIGPYVEGWLRAHGFSDPARQHAREAVAPLLRELPRHAIGQVHEIYDGDEPHRPGGCPAQAWSIAEILRASLLI